MTGMTRRDTIVFVALLVLISAGTGLTIHHYLTATPAYHCTAGPDEQCASDQWYADYLHLKKLQAPYTPPKDTGDLINGIATRLRTQIPAGYDWDDGKERFVKRAQPTATPPAQPQPTATPPAQPQPTATPPAQPQPPTVK